MNFLYKFCATLRNVAVMNMLDGHTFGYLIVKSNYGSIAIIHVNEKCVNVDK